MLGEPGQEPHEILAGELPLKWAGDLLVVGFEAGETLLDFVERVKVIRGKNLALGDREIDLNLVEPTGMVRRVNHPGVGPLFSKAGDAPLPAVNGGIVNDPKDSSRTSVRPSAHDVGDEQVKRDDARLGDAAAEEFGAVNIPGRDIGQGPLTEVLVFEAHGSGGCRACGEILASTGLDAGLLIGTDDKVLSGKGSAAPTPLVQIENPAGFLSEVRVSGKDPATMSPWANGILAQPTPQRRLSDRGDDATPDDFPLEVGRAEA